MFDTKKFQKAKFIERNEDVPVPDLKDFYAPKEEAIWVIKGLTGKEYGKVKEAAAKNSNILAMVEALATDSKKGKVDGLKKAFGVGEVPQDVAERIEILVAGSVDPKCDTELALTLCESFPVDFYNITNKILQLTGKGQELGKQKSSGKKTESEQA